MTRPTQLGQRVIALDLKALLPLATTGDSLRWLISVRGHQVTPKTCSTFIESPGLPASPPIPTRRKLVLGPATQFIVAMGGIVPEARLRHDAGSGWFDLN